jgi:transcriptional regulator with XRE-family HTH domain
VPEASSPLLPRRELAVTLRRLRLEAGKTLSDAAEALEVSSATISRYETGHRLPRGRDVRDLGLLYGLTPGPALDRLVAMATDAREPGWWESYSEVEDEAHSTWIGLEAAAELIDIYESTLVPGLLQTPDYTRALLRSGPFRPSGEPYTEQEIEHHVEIRRRRQEILARRNVAVQVVVDESVIARRVGSSEVMRTQLRDITHMAESGKVDVRLLPFAGGAHPGMLGPFMIVRVASKVIEGAVYMHSMAGDVTLDDAEDLRRCHALFAALRERALDARASIEAIRAAH